MRVRRGAVDTYGAALYPSSVAALEQFLDILLKPDSDNPRFCPIVLTPADEAEVRVIAELVRVLAG